MMRSNVSADTTELRHSCGVEWSGGQRCDGRVFVVERETRGALI